jgi:hypothetical protein
LLLGKTKTTAIPSNIETSQLPNAFSDFFQQKIVNIRNKFQTNDNDTLPPSSNCYSGPVLSNFAPVSPQFVREILLKTAKKTCELDPIPTHLMYDNLDLLLPAVTNIFNKSLTEGSVPTEFKTALVKPLLKKTIHGPKRTKELQAHLKSPFSV